MPGNGQWILSIVSHCIFIMLKWVTHYHHLQTYLKLLNVAEGRSIQGLLLRRASRGRSYCSSCEDKWDSLRKPSLIFPWDGQVAERGSCCPKEGERRAATRQARWWPQQQGAVPWHQRQVSRAEWWLQQVLLTVWWASSKEEVTCQVQGESRKSERFRYRARDKHT